MADPDKGIAAGGKIRVDKWLWYSRTVKSRTLAQGLIKAGKVRVNNSRISSPSRMVEVDDVLTITLARQIRILKIVDVGTRRGPAPEAQMLYEDLSPPPPKRDAALRPARQAVREEGAGRPTKKERRALSRFRQDAGQEI